MLKQVNDPPTTYVVGEDVICLVGPRRGQEGKVARIMGTQSIHVSFDGGKTIESYDPSNIAPRG